MLCVPSRPRAKLRISDAKRAGDLFQGVRLGGRSGPRQDALNGGLGHVRKISKAVLRMVRVFKPGGEGVSEVHRLIMRKRMNNI